MRLRLSVIAIAVLAPLTAFAEDAPASAPAAAAPSDATPAAAPVVTTTPAVAEPAPAAPATAAAPAKGWKDLLVIEGLVDSYYMYNFSGANSLSGPTTVRNFDLNSNTFTLNYAKVGIGLSAEKAGFRLDLGYGATGAIINSAVPPGAPAAGPAAATAFIVQQAYATLTPIDGLSIDFGKFVTTAGAEVIEANKNWLYSRSILFFNIPLLHNGVRAGYKINDMVSVQASLVNGWNGQGLTTYTTGDKTFSVNASINLPVGVAIIPTIYFGDTGSGSNRFLGDLVATYSAGPLGLNLNFDFVQDTNAGIDPFIGVAAMGHYVVNDYVNATLRGEYAQQKTGGATQKWYEVTVGAAFPFSGHYEIRPELRWDGANPGVYGTLTPPSDKNQITGTIAALAYF